MGDMVGIYFVKPRLGRLDEADQLLDVFGVREGSAHFFEGLGSVELGAQEKAVSLLDGLDAGGREAVAFEADFIDAVALRAARRDDYGEGRHVLGDHGVRADVGVAPDARRIDAAGRRRRSVA